MSEGRTVGMLRNEQGWVLLEREGEEIYPTKMMAGETERKDEIIVEMSEMSLRALHFVRGPELTSCFVERHCAKTLSWIVLSFLATTYGRWDWK
jgi:hypothetical protein